MILCSADNCLQGYALGQRKGGAAMRLIELLTVALAVPGAVDALCDIWARRAIVAHATRPIATRLEIDLHVSLRRG
jgi:hypothetical protein